MTQTRTTRFSRAIYLCVGLAGVGCYLLGRVWPSEWPSRDLFINLASELAGVAIIFLIVEEFIGWNPLQAQQAEFATSLLHKTEALIQSSFNALRSKAYHTREASYAAAAQTIIQVSQQEPGEKAIMIAALHGHPGRRRTIFPSPDPAFESFAREMEGCERSSGSGKWYMRELYNVTDEDRFRMVINRMRSVGNAEGFEVRAFCIPNMLPQLTPLVIGKENLFIGIDDQAYYGIRSVFHIQGQEAVRLATEYFDSLWNDPRSFHIRTGVGINEENIKSLRAAIRALSTNPAQPPPAEPNLRA